MYNKYIRAIGIALIIIVVVPRLLILLGLMRSTSGYDIFYVNMIMIFNFTILGAYFFLKLSSRDPRYQKMMSIYIWDKLYTTLSRSEFFIVLFSISHFMIVLVTSIDIIRRGLVQESNLMFRMPLYRGGEFWISISIVLLYVILLLFMKHKAVKSISGVVFMLTYTYIGWIHKWSYLLIGTVCVFLYLVATQLISKKNFELVMTTPSYRNLAGRIMTCIIIIIIGIAVILMVS